MNPFAALQKQAARKRDNACARARAEYRDTCQRIQNLRDALGEPDAPPNPTKIKPIIELIQELIPQDRAFTFADVMRILAGAEPTREFSEPSIRSMIAVLAKRGVVRRVTTDQKGRVLWAAADAEIAESPFGMAPLVDVAESMLQKHGPMMPAELVVAIHEAGYRQDADPHATMAAVRQLLRRYSARFKRGEDGRWAAAAYSPSTE